MYFLTKRPDDFIIDTSDSFITNLLFTEGADVQPKKDLTRYVKWPKYIRLQRQKRVLYQRLKVPPAINQFTQTLDKNTGMYLLF